MFEIFSNMPSVLLLSHFSLIIWHTQHICIGWFYYLLHLSNPYLGPLKLTKPNYFNMNSLSKSYVLVWYIFYYVISSNWIILTLIYSACINKHLLHAYKFMWFYSNQHIVHDYYKRQSNQSIYFCISTIRLINSMIFFWELENCLHPSWIVFNNSGRLINILD